MDITLEYIRQKFDEFNRTYFGGKLKPLPLRLTNARTFLGQVHCRRKRQLDGSWRYDDFEFVISRHLNTVGEEAEREDVILHEMIHYYILLHQMQDSSPHGKIFKRIMNEINQRFHRHISVRHKATEEEHARDTQLRRHLICITRFADGTQGITVAAQSRVFRLWDELKRLPDIAEQTWYSSNDPFFNRYPRSLIAKAYLISAEDVETHIASAHRLVKNGRAINVVRRSKTDDN